MAAISRNDLESVWLTGCSATPPIAPANRFSLDFGTLHRLQDAQSNQTALSHEQPQ
jgi:hypothetical protein